MLRPPSFFIPFFFPPSLALVQTNKVGEAIVEREGGRQEAVEVLLRPYLDPEAGGLSWRPLQAEHGIRCVCACIHTRTGFLPFKQPNTHATHPSIFLLLRRSGRADSVCLLQLRCWYPPMLSDARRHTLLQRGVHQAVGLLKAEAPPERAGMTVLDVGTGTGLLSLEAAKAAGEGARVVACEGFPAVAVVAEQVVAAAGMGGASFVHGRASSSSMLSILS